MIVTNVTKMITLLKPGLMKIMRLFYINKTQKLHLREIARQTKLYEPSATRFLKELEENAILKSEKEANLKKYGVVKNKKTYLVFEAFDMEKEDKLPVIRKKAIKYYLDTLPEKPVFAILFGSTAKETFGEKSDIDILIIGNKKIETTEAEKEADALTGIKISSFQIGYKHFLKEIILKEDKVIQSAINTGYPLINHIAYYEVLYNERV
ncbi:nucleotidyltransferase domain-containing protein [Candidatus Woesearchaeota archaeon]|nr:nucleotidyltransferase domain-containing protein [Candidatus Woesearchaeota archaeon]